MGNLCCVIKNRLKKETTQIVTTEEYEYPSLFLGDVNDKYLIYGHHKAFP